MSEMKKLFVVSDIHGHYTLLKQALDNAGFDDENEDHLFICCGDLFDRGSENKKVYDFVRGLKHKVLICGNHDERLDQAMTERKVDAYDIRNGMLPTLEEFFGYDCIGDMGQLRFHDAEKMIDGLFALFGEMKNYYETKNYVFVHGWLPTQPYEIPPRLLDDWRNADEKAWSCARFSEWMSMYRSPAMLEGKTVICGHRPTRLAVRVDDSRSPADSSIYYGDGMIAIDAGTIRSGRVNLLLLEDEIYE